MEIQVRVKSVYGNTLVYPVCDKAKLLAKLVGKKTLTVESLRIIVDLGYTVTYIASTSYGVYINSPHVTKCGPVTTAYGVRSWDSLADANEFIAAQGWVNSTSVPDHGLTAYAFQLHGATAS